MDKTKIIVVEDNIVYCEFVCNLLARKGFRTVQAFHLSTAKKYLQQAADGDIVVSDLRLPDGNGIDLLRWMMGDEVDEVYGVTKQQFHDYLQCEDIGMAVVKFKNGAVGTIEGTVNVYPKNLEETLYLFGETGTVKLGGTSTNNIDVWNFADESDADAKNKGLQEATSNVYGNGHTSLFADMMDAIEQDRKPYVDAVAGRNALEMILAIYQSAATGKPVKLPLEHTASTDFTGRFDK